MKYEIKEQTTCLRKIEIEIPGEEVEKEKDRLFKKYVRSMTIPGFRKGKTPLHVLKARIGKGVEEEALHSLIDPSYKAVLDELKFKPISRVLVDTGKYTVGEPYRFSIVFEVYPEIELNKFKDYDITQYELVVSDEMITENLEEFLEKHRNYQTIERPAQENDLIDTDVLPVDEAYSNRDRIPLNFHLDKNGPQARYVEHLIGANAGDDRRFEIHFESDARDRDLHGLTLMCEVTINGVRELKKPELTDEFVKSLNEPAYTTADDLRGSIKAAIADHFRGDTRQNMLDELKGKIFVDNPFDIPETMIEMQLESSFKSYQDDMRQRGQAVPANQFDNFRKRFRHNIMIGIKEHLVEEKIIELFHLSADEGEVLENVRQRFEHMNINFEHINEHTLEAVKNVARVQIERGRANEKLISLQKLETKTVTFDEWKAIQSEKHHDHEHHDHEHHDHEHHDHEHHDHEHPHSH